MKFFNKITNWYFSKKSLPYWAILAMDILICYLSGILVFWLYYRGAVTLGNIALLTKTIFTYMCFNLIGFKIFHTYSGIIRYSSFVDLKRVGYAMGVSLIVAEIMHYVVYSWDLEFVRLQGRQLVAMYLLATMAMWAARIVIKSIYDVSFANEGAAKTLIYGVRDGGVALAKNIRSEKPTRYLLKGFISHNPGYKSRLLMGEHVYQVSGGLRSVIEKEGISTVLVSPLQNERFRKDTFLQDLLIDAGIKILMLPETKEWDGKTDVHDLQPVSINDLLPRNEINVNMKSVCDMLKDKKILITGSAGSIGSEMVRQIASFKPAAMMLIDQAETPQHDIKLMMMNKFQGVECKIVLSSITKQARMERLFDEFRPDYVFHAAAYKHVPMMEDNPSESIQNNVYGTKVIADLSVKYGVKKFVMISTDKAVNPTNVMGCSKRICEIYTQALNEKLVRDYEANGCKGIPPTQFVTTRFGNVLGSTGSVIPLFEKQIKAGGPVTVTDPKIIRFFMLIPEACKLVLEAGTHGRGGQIFVFDMGEPVKIADLAHRMIQLSGAKDVKIVYTGLRPGEKLYEEVLSNTENTLPSFHEKIRIAKVKEYDFEQVSKEIDALVELAKSYDEMKIVGKMKEIVPEFVSRNSVYSALDVHVEDKHE